MPTESLVPIVPIVPTGATIDSFIAAVHRLNAFRFYSRTYMSILGTNVKCKSTLFGYRASICSKKISSGPFSNVETILEQHSLWPLYAYTLPTALREQWIKDQINLPAKASKIYTAKFPAHVFNSEPYFGCIECISEDIKKFGIAYWRTYHQLPGITHCIYHHCNLISSCNACGNQFSIKHDKLPNLFCRNCGEKLTPTNETNQSKPYFQVLDILKFLFDGGWQILSPDHRRTYYEIALRSNQQWPPNQKQIKNLFKSIATRWGKPNTSAIFPLFPMNISISEIKSAIYGIDYDCNPFMHIILMEHFRSTQSNLPELFNIKALESASKSCQPPLISGPYELPRDKQLKLISVLDQFGISREIAFCLANDYVENRQRNISLTPLKKYSQLNQIIPWFFAYYQFLVKMKCSYNSKSNKKSLNNNYPRKQ